MQSLGNHLRKFTPTVNRKENGLVIVRLLVHWRKTTNFYFINSLLLVELPTPFSFVL